MIDDNDKWKIDKIPEENLESIEINSNEYNNAEESMKSNITDIREISINSISGPAIMFVGPKESGKTTALLRLARHIIQEENCIVDVNRNFRADEDYKKSINFFLDSLQNNDWAPKRNAAVDFLCVNVTQNAKQICQFIEAPGEHFYDYSNPHEETFAPYLSQLFSNRNMNKTLVFFFWDGMLLGQNPAAYSLRLCKILRKLDNKFDDVVIVYNQIDKNPEMYTGVMPNLKSVKDKLFSDNNYSTFFNTLKSLKLQTQYVAFSSGDFQKLADGRMRYVESIRDFPVSLWKAIKFSITSSFTNKTRRKH